MYKGPDVDNRRCQHPSVATEWWEKVRSATAAATGSVLCRNPAALLTLILLGDAGKGHISFTWLQRFIFYSLSEKAVCIKHKI